jgi:hypothetical protein
MNRKKKILLAMQVVLQEYKEKTHISTIGSCSLCQQFHTDEFRGKEERHPCHKCPMFVFHRKTKSDYPELSCLYRKCKPVFCHEGQRMTKGLHRVIEFYEKAIDGLQNLSDEDLTKKDCFQYLVDIDKEIYEKYEQKNSTNEKSN